jgi:hypothetical protein
MKREIDFLFLGVCGMNEHNNKGMGEQSFKKIKKMVFVWGGEPTK